MRKEQKRSVPEAADDMTPIVHALVQDMPEVSTLYEDVTMHKYIALI